jgi:hypothetical protein
MAYMRRFLACRRPKAAVDLSTGICREQLSERITNWGPPRSLMSFRLSCK